MLEARILALTGAKRVLRLERIQRLWDGYGELLRAHLDTGTVIVKSVTPPPNAHPRKVRSYDVETHFYRRFAPRCDDSCRVAKLIAAEGRWLTILEDVGEPHDGDIDACLRWLAGFHVRFLGVEPDGLWKEGTYWHLATRPDELAATRDPAIRARAPIVDRALAATRFRTLVHGDAKPENFCIGADGTIAAVDFQYVGGGCGMKDVAYSLHGESTRTEARALDTYFDALGNAEVEKEWRAWLELLPRQFSKRRKSADDAVRLGKSSSHHARPFET